MEIQKLLFSVLVGIVAWSPTTQAAMSSASYEILWDTINNGGDDFSQSDSYTLRDSLGNVSIGTATSDSYTLRGGYRQGINDQTVSFRLFAQGSTTTNARSVAGTTVEVTSSDSFSVGDYIALVQDVEGDVEQTTAIGRIQSKTSTTLTVDRWSDGGTAPIIDDTRDQIYLLDGTSIAFGSLSDSVLTERLVGWEITAEAENGFTVQVASDDDLRSNSHTLANVSDGNVTIGSEEYGARSSDTTISTSTFDTQDTALATGFSAVGTEVTSAFIERQFLTLKAAISNETSSGSYAQVLTFVATANY